MLKSVVDPHVLENLIKRLTRLTPESTRRWGTLTPPELLVHLNDANGIALNTHPSSGERAAGRPSRVIKIIALYLPFKWPKGIKTLAALDPRRNGTPPAEFEQDRARVIDGLRAIAGNRDGLLNPQHPMFGPMSRANWQRWAYLHIDHHLRQFGL